MKNIEMPAQIGDPTEQKPEKNESDIIRDKLFTALEKKLDIIIEDKFPRIPEEERELEEITNSDGRIIAHHEKIREPLNESGGKHDTWLVIDFDDVINHTTTFSNYLKQLLTEELGITPEKFNELYQQSKIPNLDGKKVFRLSVLVAEIEKNIPNATNIINDIFKNTDFNDFIDQGVKRALQGIKLDINPNTRITILTYGDLDYQKIRLSGTDITSVVDDVVYTEGSKKEVLVALYNKFYTSSNDSNDNGPFIITVDDNAEHVDDYEDLPFSHNYANIQHNHSQAKRFDQKASANKAIISTETEKNQAALNLYKIYRIIKSQHAQRDRQEIFRILRRPEIYDSLMSGSFKGYVHDENISYETNNEHIIRTYQRYIDQWQLKFGENKQFYSDDWGTINEEGNLSENPIENNFVNFEEYIRETKNKQ